MSVLRRTRATAANAADTAASPTVPVPRTRAGATWVGVCTAALSSVVLIVFMLQNTRSVEVTFLWMHGTLPLALALLIAGVSVAIVAMVIGTARITQLRRLSRRNLAAPAAPAAPPDSPGDDARHQLSAQPPPTTGEKEHS